MIKRENLQEDNVHALIFFFILTEMFQYHVKGFY